MNLKEGMPYATETQQSLKSIFKESGTSKVVKNREKVLDRKSVV